MNMYVSTYIYQYRYREGELLTHTHRRIAYGEKTREFCRELLIETAHCPYSLDSMHPWSFILETLQIPLRDRKHC